MHCRAVGGADASYEMKGEALACDPKIDRSIETEIQRNLPRIREWMIDLITENAVRNILDGRPSANEDPSGENKAGRRVLQTRPALDKPD
jgi:hypothetical protein